MRISDWSSDVCSSDLHREDVGLVVAVIAQNLGNDVDFVVETFGEQRTDRTIGQTRNQGFLFGRAAFALEEAAGDAACARIFFLIMDGKRDEVLPFIYRLGKIGKDSWRGRGGSRV